MPGKVPLLAHSGRVSTLYKRTYEDGYTPIKSGDQQRDLRTTMGKLTLLLVSLFWLVACGQQPEPVPATAVFSDPTSIQLLIPTNDFALDTPRVPLVLYQGPNQVAGAQQVTVTAVDLSQETRPGVWTGEATSYSDYAVPYWVIYPEFPHPGQWGLHAEIVGDDGTTTTAQAVIEVAETPQTPAVGGSVPASQNRTIATEPDINKLTSAEEPVLALYQMTVAEALTSNRPSVIVFATPAFCQTAVCAPVVDSVAAAQAELGDQANFIHLEIYKEFNPSLVLADEVEEWRLSSEPWTFVLDTDGRVAARLGGPISPRELTAALEPLLQ